MMRSTLELQQMNRAPRGSQRLLGLARRMLGRASVVAPAPARQPPNGPPRWGWGKPPHPGLSALLASRQDVYLEQLDVIRRQRDGLAGIPLEAPDDTEPYWKNPWFTGLAAASLYSYLREHRPQRYVEIGSGNSTRFAARAKRDGGLATELVSIDPEPRTAIDALCDRVIRSRLETVDLGVFDNLVAGDIVLLDGSHRVQAGSDVVVFFLEVLPQLPPGVLVGIHDILLPDDYVPRMAAKGWNEQYMLGAILLGGSRFAPMLPCYYVATTSPLREHVTRLFSEIELAHVQPWGSLFWLSPT
jgi:hypothetical protein